MEIAPYSNHLTNQGEVLVMVPQSTLRQLEKAEAAIKALSNTQCTHPEDKLSGSEILPDFSVCACGMLLKIGDTSSEYLPTNIDELEAAIYDYFAEAFEEIDTAFSCLHSKEVEHAINFIDGVKKNNPVIISRRARKAGLRR
jgi:hypothetical protein